MSRRDVGDGGEELAAGYLASIGCRILERRYRTRLGEVDVVAEEGDHIVFVEVKARTGLAFGLPREAVDRRKRRRMTRAAFQYLAAHGEERPCRFDVIEVVFFAGSTEIRHIRDAFQPDERDLESVWV